MNAMSGGNAVLAMNGVTAGYKGSDVLRDVTLTVPSASVIALLGPNGAGKTTVLRCASGMLRSRSGSLSVGGRDLTRQPSYQVAQAGVCHIPEGRGIYPSLTVRENILMFSPHLPASDLIDSTVSAFPHLKSKLKRPAGTLSGGEQQMLALSRAYTGAPKVVLLDEVSLGLAPKIVDEIFLSIADLRQRDVSLVLVEQYVDRALQIADYVYVLKRGTVQAQGPAISFTRDRILDSYLRSDQPAHIPPNNSQHKNT